MNKPRESKITTPMLRNMIREVLMESLGQPNLWELRAKGSKRTLLEHKQYRDLLVQEGVISKLADRIKKFLVDSGYMQNEEQELEDLKTNLSNVKDKTQTEFKELKDIVETKSGDLASVLDRLTGSLIDYVNLLKGSSDLGLINRGEYKHISNELEKFTNSPLHGLEPSNFKTLGRINILVLDRFLQMLNRVSSDILRR